MQKFVSKYALAAHLSLLAVAPLFLFPYFGPGAVAVVLLCLSLFAAIWITMEPSRRANEMLHDARVRVAGECFRDPLFWVSIVIAAVYFTALMNDGVGMVYDAENALWKMSAPALAFLPGTVEGAGLLPFATAVASVVLLEGCRHALGKTARVTFLFSGGILSGLAALTAVFLCAAGNETVLQATRCLYYDASFIGTAFGIWFAGSMVSLVGLYEVGMYKVIPFSFISIGGSAAGLFLFAPMPVILLFAAVAVIAFSLALAYAGVKLTSAVAPKCAALLSMAGVFAVAFVIFFVPSEIVNAKVAQFTEWKMFPESFDALRALLTGFSLEVWSDHPWLGTGLGSFAYNIRFLAGDADWSVIQTWQKSALNGWLQLLAERGIVGFILVVAPFLFLLWTYAVRCVKMILRKQIGSYKGFVSAFHPVTFLGPLVVAAVAIGALFDCSFYRPEVYLATLSVFALAGSFFPVLKKRSENDESKNGEAENG